MREISARGFKVSTIKHAHHNFEIDHPGRDSHRHRMAGASEVAVISRHRWAIVHELRQEDEPTLIELAAKLDPCDLVIVEGYRSGPQPKLEIRDVNLDHPKIAESDESVVGIVANGAVENMALPVFDRDDIAEIAEFVLSYCEVSR